MKDIKGIELFDGCLVKIDGVSDCLMCKKMQNGELYVLSKGTENANLKLTDDVVKQVNLVLIESIKIAASEDLFNELHAIAQNIQTLANIVQNDMVVEKNQLTEWTRIFDLNVQDLTNWKESVKKHLNI